MFRELTRIRQQLSREDCIDVLQTGKRGVLSLLGDDGYPYGVPMDFWYDGDTGTICFHGARRGHKIDALRRCDKVSFCVYDEGYRREGEWALNVRSVILFGRIREITDESRIVEALRQLGSKYTTDTAYVEKEIAESTPNVLCLELIPEHMTGKLVNES